MITTENKKNGVNVDQLMATVEAVQTNPELAKFEFRAKTNWIDGGHCVTSAKSFYGVGEEDTKNNLLTNYFCLLLLLDSYRWSLINDSR